LRTLRAREPRHARQRRTRIRSRREGARPSVWRLDPWLHTDRTFDEEQVLPNGKSGDWERVAGECVAILRWAAGRDPDDRDLLDLVGELATLSEAFLRSA
jgi:MmyB-like transcription regulator ligand binding domain